MSSVMSQCTRAKERGAGPRTFLPSALYWLPWQGHMNLFSALFQGTTQPRWVHTAFRPYFSIVPSPVTIR